MTAPIPRIFHFIHGLARPTRPLHVVHYLCVESCFQINRPERIYFYYHYEPYGRYWDLIKRRASSPLRSSVPPRSQPPIRGPQPRPRTAMRICPTSCASSGSSKPAASAADLDTIFVNAIPDVLFRRPSCSVRKPMQYSERRRAPGRRCAMPS